MASARFAWGIDVGNRALKAVKLVRDGGAPGGFRVDDFELIEHETVLSNAGDNRESLVQTALANFVQRHPDMKGGVVAVGVAGQQSFARFIKLPPVEPKKIPEIVRFEAIQQIPFPLDDVEWSYQLFQAPESPDVEVGIFAMRKDLVNRHIGFFTDFDLNVQVVQMNPLAVYNAMYHDDRLAGGTVMVIDMGAENTDLIISDNDTIWMRSIPIGGNNFTEALSKAFKVPFAKAEELKRTSQSSKYAKQIFQAMRPIFADLVAEIQRSIGFYASVHRDSRISKVLALGGTFRLPGLQKYLQQNLSLDVEKLDALVAGGPDDAKMLAQYNENILSVVSAYGLALQAMGDAKITSSLLPAAIRREKMWREKTKWFAAAAALFVIGAGVAFARYELESVQYKQAVSNEQPKTKAVRAAAERDDREWEENVMSGGVEERKQIKQIEGLTHYRTLWPHLLLDIQDTLPKPQPQVVAGLAKNDKSLVVQVPRGQRNLMTIDSLSSRFVADLGPITSDPDFTHYVDTSTPSPVMGAIGGATDGGSGYGGGGYAGGGSGTGMGRQGGAGGASSAMSNGMNTAGVRGYLITIHATSPHLDKAKLVNDVFILNLAKIKPGPATPDRPDRPHQEYAVVKASIIATSTIRADANRLGRLKAEYEAAKRATAAAEAANGGATAPGAAPGSPLFGGGMGGTAPIPSAGPANDDEAFKDRLTGESVLDDSEFTILVAVAIDPPFYLGAGGATAELPAGALPQRPAVAAR